MTDTVEFSTRIRSTIPENIELGLFIFDTKTCDAIKINENEYFPLASIAKFITSVFSLNRNAPLESVQKSISHHDSESYQKLNTIISDKEINDRLHELNLDVMVHKENQDKIHNIGTPEGVATFLKYLIDEELLNHENTKNILEALRTQKDPDGFRFQGQWLHMTGGLEGVCNDVGYLIIEDRPIIIAGFIKTTHVQVSWSHLEAGLRKIGEIINDRYTLNHQETHK
ncbi:serine hydrolase [Rossellomorea aquimaris]|uniref:serine hydrolase n=1 Tax=Rossellomorea aquimaris TaxID=189382 RepID=UPI0007D07438|nr:serine hydrolase [Rossellomorea aquimaris]